MKIREIKLDLVVDGVKLPSMLTVPKLQKPIANILIIPGSLFSDVDGNYQFPGGFSCRPHMYADLSRQLAEKGYNVFRYAKHGPGTGSEVLDKSKEVRYNHFEERMVVAKAALELLQKNTDSSCGNFIAGHSEGSLVAFKLAQNSNVKIDGVISLSGPACRFFDLMPEQAAKYGEKKDDSDRMSKQFSKMFSLIRCGEPLSKDLLNDPILKGFTELSPEAWQYIKEMDAIDPKAEIEKVEQPVLIVQGGLDGSVPADHAEKLREKRSSAASTKVAFFENLQHFYKRTIPAMKPMESFALSSETDPSVAEEINQWISKVLYVKNSLQLKCKL